MAVPPEIAFAVASDVAAYKQFLPLLTRSVVRGPRVRTEEGESFDAELAVSYPKLGLTESFVSRVETFVASRLVRAVSTDGPFRSLTVEWLIKDGGSGSDVSVSIDYAFRNPFIQIAAAGVMDFAVQKVMAAFEARARQVMAEAS